VDTERSVDIFTDSISSKPQLFSWR